MSDYGAEWGGLIQAKIEEDIGPSLIPAWVAEEIAANARRQMDSILFQIIRADPLTWEERLALAIEQRSVRNRLRRIPARVRWARSEWATRLHYAYRALRGEWGDW